MRFLMALGVVGFAAGGAHAGQLLTYSITFTGSGTLGADAFNGATVTIEGTGDIDDRIHIGPLYRVPLLVAGVEVSGLAPATLTETFSVNSSSAVGSVTFNRSPGSAQLLGISSPALIGYDLSSLPGALAGTLTNSLVLGTPYATTAGTLVLNSASDLVLRVSTVVPEPSTLISGGLAATAGLGLAWRHRRREGTRAG